MEEIKLTQEAIEAIKEIRQNDKSIILDYFAKSGVALQLSPDTNEVVAELFRETLNAYQDLVLKLYEQPK